MTVQYGTVWSLKDLKPRAQASTFCPKTIELETYEIYRKHIEFQWGTETNEAKQFEYKTLHLFSPKSSLGLFGKNTIISEEEV